MAINPLDDCKLVKRVFIIISPGTDLSVSRTGREMRSVVSELESE